MNSTNEKLIFQLENKKTKKSIYQHDVELLKFQKETIENENVSFFYTFKDMGVELEEKIISKLKLNGDKDQAVFVVKYSDKVLYESILEINGIDDINASKNEVELYFIFEKLEKIIITKIAETHKDIVLSNIERN